MCLLAGSGSLSRAEFESFMRVASGEPEDPAAPPDGSSANLDTVAEGSQILAFYSAYQLWYDRRLRDVDSPEACILPSSLCPFSHQARYECRYAATVEGIYA